MNRYRALVFLLVLLGVGGVARASSDANFAAKGDAGKKIHAAIIQAVRERKNIVLDFGADWCGDCHALEAQMQEPELASLISANYVVVNIDVGMFDKNLDLALKYHVPLKKGIPALAILDSHGKLIYAQDQGQFEDARHVTVERIKAIFERWKPKE